MLSSWWQSLIEWWQQLPADFAFLLALPFMVAALGLWREYGRCARKDLK